MSKKPEIVIIKFEEGELKVKCQYIKFDPIKKSLHYEFEENRAVIWIPNIMSVSRGSTIVNFVDIQDLTKFITAIKNLLFD